MNRCHQAIMAVLAVGFGASVGAAQAPVVPPRPTVAPAKDFAYPKITLQTLPSGLRMAVIENHTLPIVAVRVGFGGGYFPGVAVDAPGKEGAWTLMLSQLREGTTTRSATAINAAFSDLGTTLNWPTGIPSSGAPSYTTIRSAWRPALDLVAEMIRQPAFPADAFARAQAAQATSAARPAISAIPLRILTPRLFGADHQYARYFATDSSIRRITRDDIVALHQAYVRPQNTVIVVAGDVTPGEARAAIERAFGSWDGGGKPIDSLVAAGHIPPQPTTIYLRDAPGATTTLLMTGTAVSSRMSRDGPALELADAILGGASQGSRMWDAFRGRRGLSYQPVSALQWARVEPQSANWLVTATVPVDKTDSAIVELTRVISGIHGSQPVTSDELSFARNNLIGKSPIQFATTDAAANSVLSAIKNGISTTFFDNYARRLGAVRLEDVQAVASRYLDPAHLVLVVVGDRAKIEGPLRATGIPVVIVDR